MMGDEEFPTNDLPAIKACLMHPHVKSEVTEIYPNINGYQGVAYGMCGICLAILKRGSHTYMTAIKQEIIKRTKNLQTKGETK